MSESHAWPVVAVAGDDLAALRRAIALLRLAAMKPVNDATSASVMVLVLAGSATDRIGAIGEHSKRRPATTIVATMPDRTPASPLRRALQAGAAGLIFDGDVETALAPTVLAVASGQLVVPQALQRNVARAPLSYREREVLGLVVRGYTNRQIADALFLAESTVKTHLSSVFGKLDARSRAEAATLALDSYANAALILTDLGPAQVG